MQIVYKLPRPDLRAFVRAYYLFETQTRLYQPLAAELGNIRCLLNGTGRIFLPDGGEAAIAPTTLIGPTMGAYALEAEPGMRVFGIGVLPRGWKALFGVDASELADRIVDLTALGGPQARAASETIRSAERIDEMADAADLFFADALERRRACPSDFPAAFERWLADADEPDLDVLADMMDCSRRQIDRLAKRHFGASPKLLQRKERVLRAADRLLFDNAPGWVDAAGPSFYDQSHFIKEFRAFVGVSPGVYIRNRKALTPVVQAARRSFFGGANL